jgi:hypothetical protein
MFRPPFVRFRSLAALVLLTLSACASTSKIAQTKAPESVPLAGAGTQALSVDTMDRSIVVYEPDAMCTGLLPRTVVLHDSSPDSAVREVMRSRALASLPIGETKVRVEARSALVDMRLMPGTTRSLHRLSSCEALALLGAIRLTLRANQAWGISQVVFTDRGDLLAI